jgi:hypothetical protein
MSENTPNPYEIAAQFIADWWRDHGQSVTPAFVAITSAAFADGSEVVVPLGPPRDTFVEAVIDGIGKSASVALVMRSAGHNSDGDKPDNTTKPDMPTPETESPRELATVH